MMLQKNIKKCLSALEVFYQECIRTEVSPEEYLAYTTEEKEKVKVQEYAEKIWKHGKRHCCAGR